MLYEVPYNFDEALISFYKKNATYINYIYLPPYKDDSLNTRSSIQTQKKGRCYMPLSREEYENHLKKINSAGLRFVVLWQDMNSILSKGMLEYYYHLNASGFIVGNDTNAAIIKDFNPDLLSICSIVQRTCKDINHKDLSNYDFIILYYPFNRSLDALKKLSYIKDKIILMPNTLCNVDCPSIHHWFPADEHSFNAEKDCWMTLHTIENCGLIFPEHLELFDNFVGGYKIQGREYSTQAIKYICKFYFTRKKSYDFVDPFLRTDMAEKIKNLIQSTKPDIYYNTKTPEIIKYL